jgi:response regulator of citrate/malate metabolism
MGKRILLVTSSPHDRWSQLVQDIIERGEGMLSVVDPVRVDQEVNKLLPSNTVFDLVLVDSFSIQEIANAIGKLHSLRVAKEIIVLTAAPGWRQARDVFRAGAHDYRFKTYNVGELQRILNLASSPK